MQSKAAYKVKPSSMCFHSTSFYCPFSLQLKHKCLYFYLQNGSGLRFLEATYSNPCSSRAAQSRLPRSISRRLLNISEHFWTGKTYYKTLLTYESCSFPFVFKNGRDKDSHQNPPDAWLWRVRSTSDSRQ